MIKLRVIASAAGLVGILLPGCSKEPTDPVLLDIGDRRVARSEFEDYIQEAMLEQAPFARAELKAQLLEQFIEEQLLLKAAEEEGIRIAPEELAVLPLGADSMEDEESAEAENGAGMKSRHDLEAYLQVRKLLDDKVLKDVRVDDEEVVDYYEENRAYYKRPQAVDISQILVETEEEANRVLEELGAQSAQFEELASRLSVGPEAAQGGRLGTFRRGELPASFEEAVFSLQKGKLSAVVETGFGYHIFRVNEVRPARDLTLEEVRDAIRVELLREKSDEAMILYLDELKERFPVRIYIEQLDFPYNEVSSPLLPPLWGEGSAFAKATADRWGEGPSTRI